MNRTQFLVTRRSLVDRLANWSDQKNWQEFYDTYSQLIHSVAKRAGMSEGEAEEVVQETVITIAKKAEAFRYDPAVGSFKGWVLTITRWRINDQFRKREAHEWQGPAAPRDRERTATVERFADPASVDLDAIWNSEWQQNVLHAAIERVKKAVEPRQFQIFDCYVVKNWPARKVASELRVNIGQVYLARHRIGALIRKEVARLEKGAR